jgi:hypothetical protein
MQNPGGRELAVPQFEAGHQSPAVTGNFRTDSA